jgi:hypothetical protein
VTFYSNQIPMEKPSLPYSIGWMGLIWDMIEPRGQWKQRDLLLFSPPVVSFGQAGSKSSTLCLLGRGKISPVSCQDSVNTAEHRAYLAFLS